METRGRTLSNSTALKQAVSKARSAPASWALKPHAMKMGRTAGVLGSGCTVRSLANLAQDSGSTASA